MGEPREDAALRPLARVGEAARRHQLELAGHQQAAPVRERPHGHRVADRHARLPQPQMLAEREEGRDVGTAAPVEQRRVEAVVPAEGPPVVVAEGARLVAQQAGSRLLEGGEVLVADRAQPLRAGDRGRLLQAALELGCERPAARRLAEVEPLAVAAPVTPAGAHLGDEVDPALARHDTHARRESRAAHARLLPATPRGRPASPLARRLRLGGVIVLAPRDRPRDDSARSESSRAAASWGRAALSAARRRGGRARSARRGDRGGPRRAPRRRRAASRRAARGGSRRRSSR